MNIFHRLLDIFAKKLKLGIAVLYSASGTLKSYGPIYPFLTFEVYFNFFRI